MSHQNLADILYLVGHEDDKWPMLKESSNFFMKKFSKMNYLTVGMERFPHSDFLINSKIVSNWHIVSLSNSENDASNCDTFKTIKSLATVYEDYSGENPNVHFGMEQFIDYDTTTLHEFQKDPLHSNRNDFIKVVRNLESLEVVRIDSSGNERWILNEIFEAGFFPSMIYVRFSESPETNVLTRNMIGNMRMMGYALLYIYENKYVFYYTGDSSYDLFNVNECTMQNPYTGKIIKTTLDAYKEWNENKTPGFNIKINKYYKN